MQSFTHIYLLENFMAVSKLHWPAMSAHDLHDECALVRVRSWYDSVDGFNDAM